MSKSDSFVEKFGELISTSTRAYEHAKTLEGSKYKHMAINHMPHGSEEKINELLEHDWQRTYELMLQYKKVLLSAISSEIVKKCCVISMSEAPAIFGDIFSNNPIGLSFVLQAFTEMTDLAIENKKIIAQAIIDSQREVLESSDDKPKRSSCGFKFKKFPNLGQEEHEWHQFSTFIKDIDHSLYLSAMKIEVEKAFVWRNTELKLAIDWMKSIKKDLQGLENSSMLLKEAEEKLFLLEERFAKLQVNEVLQDLYKQIELSNKIEFPCENYLEDKYQLAKKNANYNGIDWDNTSTGMPEGLNDKSMLLIGDGDDFAEFYYGFEILHNIDQLMHSFVEYVWIIDLEDSILSALKNELNDSRSLKKLSKHIDEYEFYGGSLPYLFENYICDTDGEFWESTMISGHYKFAYIDETDFKNYLMDLHQVHKEILNWVIERVPDPN